MCKSASFARFLLVAVLIVTACGATCQNVQATAITWGTPTAITTADATLTQPGTVVEAAYTGSAPIAVTLTGGQVITFESASLNGIPSGAAVNVTGDPAAEIGGFAGDTGNASFNNVLTTFCGGPTRRDITVNNLVAGRQYTVQLFALDDRNGTTQGWQASYADTADYSGNNSAVISMGDNKYVMGTFTATGTSVTLYEQCLTWFGAVNATYAQFGSVVVRDITPIPEPGTLVFCGTGLLGLLAYAWRKRK